MGILPPPAVRARARVTRVVFRLDALPLGQAPLALRGEGPQREHALRALLLERGLRQQLLGRAPLALRALLLERGLRRTCGAEKWRDGSGRG